MSAFTDQEIEYLAGQRLGRIATVGADGQPHVVPTSRPKATNLCDPRHAHRCSTRRPARRRPRTTVPSDQRAALARLLRRTHVRTTLRRAAASGRLFERGQAVTRATAPTPATRPTRPTLAAR